MHGMHAAPASSRELQKRACMRRLRGEGALPPPRHPGAAGTRRELVRAGVALNYRFYRSNLTVISRGNSKSSVDIFLLSQSPVRILTSLQIGCFALYISEKPVLETRDIIRARLS